MAIPLPVTKTKIATVPWGIPITNEVNRLTGLVDAYFTPTWTNFVFGTDWQQFAGSTVCSWFQIGKLVVLRGLAQAKIATPGNSPVVTIPVGARPVSANLVSTSQAGPCDVFYTSGSLAKSTTAASTSWLSLDGLSWYVP